MKLNNKGFTFVEILAVIVLIGVLSSIAIVGVSRYKENAKNKDYEALAKASYNAMEEYMMKNPYKKEVSLETLANDNFLSNRTDPATKNTVCSGAVIVETKENGSAGKMDKNEYIVHLCCTNYKKTYIYPEGTVSDLEDESYCDFEEAEEEGSEIPSVTPGSGSTPTTVKVTLNNNGATTAGTASVNVKVGDTKLPTITLPKKTVTITYVNNVSATVSGGDKSKNYTLNGWYTAVSGGNKVASNATTPVLQKSVSGYTDSSGKWAKKSNTTLYAHWDPVTATLPTVTKSGYTCKWTTVDGGETKERASGGTWTFTSANSRTFTAVCTKNTTTQYTVTLNNNGATTAGTASVNVKVGDTKLPTITIPKKTVTITYVNNVGATVSGGDKSKNYTLNGWYTATSGGNKVASNATTPVLQKSVSGYTDSSGKWAKKSNTTLYAQWSSVTATLPTITKSGYTCKWTTVDGGQTKERTSGGTWTFSSANSRTFTAVCTANTITVKVTFKTNGSGGSDITRTCNYLESSGSGCKIKSPNITRSGYTKVGWNTSSSAKNSTWDQNTEKTFKNNATYYAITYKTIKGSFNFKISDSKDLSIAENNGKLNNNQDVSCKLYNTSSSCTIKTPTCNFGKTITPYKQSINKYFTCKWGTIVAGNNMSISNNANYTISVTTNSEYVDKEDKIILYSTDGNNNIQIRNNQTPTLGISKNTLQGYYDDGAYYKWDGKWMVDKNNHLVWLHGSGVKKGKKCKKVKTYNLCDGHESDYMTGYVSTRVTKY